MKVHIDRLGQFGDGMAIVDSAPIAIPKTLPGDVVEVEAGRVVRLVTPSGERQAAFCPRFDVCGGCKFQHWQAGPYAAWKRDIVVSALRNKGLEVDVENLVEAHGEGRRRVTLHVRQQAGTWVAGFMVAKSHDLCTLERCPILVQPLLHAPQVAAAFGPILGPCDVSLTAADNGIDVSIKAERSAVPRRLEILHEVFRRFQLLRLSVNGDVLASLSPPVVHMGTASVPLPLNSFLQATRRGEDVLAELVIAGVGKAKHVADLFCGVGPFALRLAERVRVSAFDSDKPAIASLKQAASATRGLKPIHAEARDLFRAPLVAMELKDFDAVVFDPPRAGAEAQARQIAKSKIGRAVAVSCDVQSFARDAAILVEAGFALKRVVPVDQFAWTAHVECVGWFER